MSAKGRDSTRGSGRARRSSKSGRLSRSSSRGRSKSPKAGMQKAPVACPHVKTARLTMPTASSIVYKDECTQCFDNQDMAGGVNVCLTCFNGGCDRMHHAASHATKRQHPIALNIRRSEKPSSKEKKTKAKITKVALGVPGGAPTDEKEYDYTTKVICYSCGGVEIDATAPELGGVVAGVLAAESAAKKDEVKAWSMQLVPCEHTKNLVQDANPPNLGANSKAMSSCQRCDLNENLWLCLTCGALGCGRRHYDGSGGRNHGVEHGEATGHAVVVKLGTIQPDGTGDVHCYKCDEERVDKNLPQHLKHFGIDVKDQSKTEKSIAELELDQNLNLDFTQTREGEQQLANMYGPGYTGLDNLGNSCYMSSVLQVLFALPPFQQRYYRPDKPHSAECSQSNPARCMQCQLAKLADGLLSGKYSEEGEDKMHSVSPGMFKSLVGRDHYAFSTMRQQDATEFYDFLLTQINTIEGGATSRNPVRSLTFELEQRLQCLKCKGVRYSSNEQEWLLAPVPEAGNAKGSSVNMLDCFKLFGEPETIQGFACPACKEATTAQRTSRLATFPRYLFVQVRRFVFDDWVPRKLDTNVIIPDVSDLAFLHGTGLQAKETQLPADVAPAPQVDEAAVAQLMDMGFPRNRCEKALIKTGNSGAEMAAAWLFEHMNDADIDEPVAAPGGGGGGSGGPSPGDVAMLTAMGFSEEYAVHALKTSNNNVEAAANWLFSHGSEPLPAAASGGSGGGGVGKAKLDTGSSRYRLRGFATHRGTSTQAGHYVAHVLKDGVWILYNDHHVAALPGAPPSGAAYLYCFERSDK